MVSNHKRLNYGQPQAGASGLPGCGEERREDPVRIGRGYTRAVILNRDFDEISFRHASRDAQKDEHELVGRHAALNCLRGWTG